MNRLLFTPDMFSGLPMNLRQQMADLAQLQYNLWITKQTAIYGVIKADGTITWGFGPHWRGNTHTARLIDIKEIGDR